MARAKERARAGSREHSSGRDPPRSPLPLACCSGAARCCRLGRDDLSIARFLSSRARRRSASDLDDDLDSYFTSKGGSGEGGEGGGDEGETAPKRGKGKGGGKGKGKGKTEREPATTGGLDDDLDSYFAQKKAATEE